MKRVVLPVSVLAFGLLTFVSLCLLWPVVSLSMLLLFHFGLQLVLVWLLVAFFRKDRKRRTVKVRGEKIYGDVDLSTRLSSYAGEVNAAQGHW